MKSEVSELLDTSRTNAVHLPSASSISFSQSAARDAAVIPRLEMIVGDADLKVALDKLQPLPVLVAVADENDRLG
jgi:hypothetical protein